MKKTAKILSLFLVVAMLATSLVFATQAAEPDVSLKYDIEAMDPSAVNGAEGVYKLTLSVKTAPGVSVLTNSIPIQYDKTLFAPVCTSNGALPTTAAGWRQTAALARQKAAVTWLGDCADTNYYHLDGTLATEEDAEVMNQGRVDGHTNWATVVRNVQPANIGTLDSAKYAAIVITQDLADYVLGLISVGDYEPFMSLYFYALDTAADVSGAEFGTIVVDEEHKGRPAEFVKDNDGNLAFCSDSSMGNFVVTSHEVVNATVPAAAGPALTYAGRQVKMTVKDGKVVSGTEQLRVVSTISAEDWNNYFANTTDAEATTKKILDVGFVAFKGKLADFDVDTAKAAAQDPKNAAAGYSVAATTYIQNDVANTGTYRFGARVEYQSGDVFDTTYMAFVHYKDASGIEKYAFYDTSDIGCLEFKTNYTTITDAYIGHVSGK